MAENKDDISHETGQRSLHLCMAYLPDEPLRAGCGSVATIFPANSNEDNDIRPIGPDVIAH